MRKRIGTGVYGRQLEVVYETLESERQVLIAIEGGGMSRFANISFEDFARLQSSASKTLNGADSEVCTMKPVYQEGADEEISFSFSGLSNGASVIDVSFSGWYRATREELQSLVDDTVD